MCSLFYTCLFFLKYYGIVAGHSIPAIKSEGYACSPQDIPRLGPSCDSIRNVEVTKYEISND